jgi:hypothetical protein
VETRRKRISQPLVVGRTMSALWRVEGKARECFRHQLLLSRKTQTLNREFDRLNWTEDYIKDIL